MPQLSKLDPGQVLRGSYDDERQRLRVDAEVEAVIGPLDIAVDAADGDNIAIADPSGTNYLQPNPDGSLNVVVQESTETTSNIFGQVTGVVSGVTTTIMSYTALSDTKLLSVDVGGTNVAEYTVYFGASPQARKFTYYTTLNEHFGFGQGLPVPAGTLIQISVVHQRPDAGEFVANVLVLNG